MNPGQRRQWVRPHPLLHTRRYAAGVMGVIILTGLPDILDAGGSAALLAARLAVLATLVGVAAWLFARRSPLPDRMRVSTVLSLGLLVTVAVLLTGGAASPLRLTFFPLAVYVAVSHAPRAGIPLLAGVMVMMLTPLYGLADPRQVREYLIMAASLAGSCLFALHAASALQQQHRQSRHLQVAADAARRLATPHLDGVLQGALDLVLSATGGHSGAVFLADAAGERLTLRALHAAGADRNQREVMRQCVLPLGVGLNGWAAQHRTSVMSGDAERDPRTFLADPAVVSDQSEIAVPLLSGDRVLGSMWVARAGLHQFTGDDLHLVEALGGQVAAAVEHARLYQRLDQLANTDPLTGTYNRHYLAGLLAAPPPEWVDRKVAVIMADVRRFKAINDQFGHVIGDRVLQHVARSLQQSAGAGNPVVRYGGDEFLVLIPAVGPGEAAAAQARLAAALAQADAGGLPPAEVSFGHAVAPGRELADAIDAADRDMYRRRREQPAAGG